MSNITGVNMNVVAENRTQISRLGGILGGKYFTIGAQETYPDFDKKKLENERSASLEFMPNRTPRRFIVRGHDVISQAIVTSADGTTKVVFNPGSAEEAESAIISGNGTFGATTEDAIKSALGGQKVIFANGTQLVDKANQYNQAEVDRLTAFINALTKQRDAIISTMDTNKKKAATYEKEILDSTPKPNIDNGGTTSIVIQKADTSNND